jgi:hypothetical protein
MIYYSFNSQISPRNRTTSGVIMIGNGLGLAFKLGSSSLAPSPLTMLYCKMYKTKFYELTYLSLAS